MNNGLSKEHAIIYFLMCIIVHFQNQYNGELKKEIIKAYPSHESPTLVNATI